MADVQQTESVRGASAPYTSFPSAKTLLKSLKEHGVPGRIDRSVLTNFSGAVGGQLLTAFKFLGLTDGSGHPTDRLKSLAEAYGTDQWADALKAALQSAYAPVFVLNLETASPSQFNETFRKTYPGTDEVQRKCITFFLSAARDAGIKVSAYIMKNKKPRGGTPKKRNGKAATLGSATSRTDPPPPPPPPSHSGQFQPTNEFQLVALLDPAMSEVERSAVWTLIQYLKTKGARSTSTS